MHTHAHTHTYRHAVPATKGVRGWMEANVYRICCHLLASVIQNEHPSMECLLRCICVRAYVCVCVRACVCVCGGGGPEFIPYCMHEPKLVQIPPTHTHTHTCHTCTHMHTHNTPTKLFGMVSQESLYTFHVHEAISSAGPRPKHTHLPGSYQHEHRIVPSPLDGARSGTAANAQQSTRENKR